MAVCLSASTASPCTAAAWRCTESRASCRFVVVARRAVPLYRVNHSTSDQTLHGILFAIIIFFYRIFISHDKHRRTRIAWLPFTSRVLLSSRRWSRPPPPSQPTATARKCHKKYVFDLRVYVCSFAFPKYWAGRSYKLYISFDFRYAVRSIRSTPSCWSLRMVWLTTLKPPRLPSSPHPLNLSPSLLSVWGPLTSLVST